MRSVRHERAAEIFLDVVVARAEPVRTHCPWRPQLRDLLHFRIVAEEEGFDFAQYEVGTHWHALVCRSKY